MQLRQDLDTLSLLKGRSDTIGEVKDYNISNSDYEVQTTFFEGKGLKYRKESKEKFTEA